MSLNRFRKIRKERPARETLRENPKLPFLMAMDLVLVQNQEAGRTIYRRLDPIDAREEMNALKAESHAVSEAKIAWLHAMRARELDLAEQWMKSEDPNLARLGVCLLNQNYQSLAR